MYDDDDDVYDAAYEEGYHEGYAIGYSDAEYVESREIRERDAYIDELEAKIRDLTGPMTRA